MGRLTTHVLDTAFGRPGAGIQLHVYAIDDAGDRRLCVSAVTNSDGRCDEALLEGADFTAGEYELRFEAGPYLDRLAAPDSRRRFLGTVIIRFGVDDANEHYHVPLLLSPFGYSTYRGS